VGVDVRARVLWAGDTAYERKHALETGGERILDER
jgi:hypothetical protein